MADRQHTHSRLYTEERLRRESASEGESGNGSICDSICPSITDYSPSNGRRTGMALSVTRHASTPLVIHSKIILLGYTGRESSKPTNSLPKKDKEYQYHLGVVGSGRQSAHGYPPSILVSIQEKSCKDEDRKYGWVRHDYQAPRKGEKSYLYTRGGRTTNSPPPRQMDIMKESPHLCLYKGHIFTWKKKLT